MTTLASIPIRRLQAGTYDIPQAVVPAGTTRLEIQITRQNWPAVTDTIAFGTLEISHDNGQTWREIVRMYVNGLPDEDENGLPVPDPLITNVGVKAVDGALIRGKVTLLQTERVGGSMESF